MGLVPALCIDGVTLTDSIAILEYLEETKEGPNILPEDPVTRAKVSISSWPYIYMLSAYVGGLSG